MAAFDPLLAQVSSLVQFAGNGVDFIEENEWVDHNSPTYLESGGPGGSAGAIVLNGSNQYRTLAHKDWMDAPTTGPFTAEIYVFADDHPGGTDLRQVFSSRSTAGGTTNGLALYQAASGELLLLGWNNNAARVNASAAAAIPSGAWLHVAIQRSAGGLWELFVGGVRKIATTESGVIGAVTGAPFFIGREATGSTRFFKGKMSQWRWTSGTARYTDGFTPPPPPLPEIESLEGIYGEITGTVEIAGSPSQRQLIAISYEPQVFEGEETPRRIVVGETTSAEDGTYTMQTPAFIDEVIVLALDNYGEVWRPSQAYTVGQRIRPTFGNETGFGYDITIEGNSGETEPAWWIPAGGNDTGSIGAATAQATPLWWSVAHAPITPTAIESEP